MLLLAIFLGLVFAYSLAAQRLERTVLTAPLLFTIAGVIVILLLPELAMLATEHLGASMFIAAFVAGMAVQVPFPQAGRHSIEFAAEWGQLLNLSVFFLFGTLSVATWAHWTWPMVLYALLSLTLVRMVPVALALIGTGLSRASVLFIGWFGPRGLASIVLGLV
jgi:NhaP-type Na+/H+ or K+/H+ antiporter